MGPIKERRINRFEISQFRNGDIQPDQTIKHSLKMNISYQHFTAHKYFNSNSNCSNSYVLYKDELNSKRFGEIQYFCQIGPSFHACIKAFSRNFRISVNDNILSVFYESYSMN